MTLLTLRAIPAERHVMALAARANQYRLVLLKVCAVVLAAALFLLLCVAIALMNTGVTVGLGLIAVPAAAGIAIAYMAANPILHPRRTQPQYTPADLDIAKWEPVHFYASDGVYLEGWFIPPDPTKDRATLIYVHGIGNNRGELLSEAANLAYYGYGALLFDLRNHGKSQGNITTLGYAESDDVRGAVNYLLSRPEVNSGRIGVVGHSMGAVAALRAAARMPQIRAVVAESAYASLRENIAQALVAKTGLPPIPFLPIMVWLGERATGIKIDAIAPITEVAKIAPRAVLFVHGRRDAIVNYENSRKLYEAANEPKSLVILDHAGHSEMMKSPDTYVFDRQMVKFLDRYLRGCAN